MPFTRIIQIARNEAYRIALKVAKYLFKRHFWKNNLFFGLCDNCLCAAQHTNGKSMMAIKNILFGANLTVNICVRDIYLNYYYEAYNYLH